MRESFMTYDFHSDIDRVTPDDLRGFFSTWPTPPSPSPETHHRLLAGSSHFVVAIPQGEREVAGYITALSDGVLSSYISHLEVLPAHRRQGVGFRSAGHRPFVSPEDLAWAVSGLRPPGLRETLPSRVSCPRRKESVASRRSVYD